MADEVASISLEIQLQQLKAALEKEMPESGRKGAEKLVKELTASYKQLEKTTAASIRKQEKEWEEGLDKLSGSAQQVAGLMGGVFGDLSDIVFDVGGGLGAVAGPAGLATAGILAFTVGVVAGAGALDDLVESADPAIERLSRISGTEPIPVATIDALEDYRQTSLGAEAASARLRVQVAGMAAAAFEPAIATVTGLVSELNDLAPSVTAVKEEFTGWAQVARVAVGILTLGVSEVGRYVIGLDDLAESGREAAAELQDLDRIQEQLTAHMSAAQKVLAIQADAMLAMTGASDAQQRLVRELDAIDQATQAYIDTLDLSIDADKALADAAFESAEIRKRQIVAAFGAADAERALAEAERASEAESARRRAEALVDIDARTARTEELIAVTKELRTASAEADEAAFAKNQLALWVQADQAGRAAVETQALVDQELARSTAATEAYAGSWEQVGDVIADIGPDAMDFMGKLGDAALSVMGDLQALADQRIATLQEQADAEVEQARSAAESWAETQNRAIDRMEERGEISADLANAERDRVARELQDKLAAADELAADERAAAEEAFRRSQALARASAVVAAALSAVALIPSLAYLAWGAPFAAAGLAGAALATQLATINSQKPPEFPMGRMPFAPSSGSPDHTQDVRIEPTEFIGTTRAADLLGGAPGVARVNAGQSPVPQAANFFVGRKLLARMVAESSASRPIDPRLGRRDPRYR